MDIYLIRHTTPDIELIYCYGQSDLDVKDTFDSEVDRIKSVLPRLENAKIYSSPLKRCAKLASALKIGPVNFDDRLKEFNFGEWEMKPWEEIDKDSLNYWIEDFVNRKAPGGESYQQMSDRVMEFFEEQAKSSESDNIVLISHGGTIRAILANILEMPLKNLFNINIDFSGIVKLSVKNEKPKVMFVNR